MNATILAKIRADLEKRAQQTIILPQTISYPKRKKLSPEAVKTIKELQQAPRGAFGGPVGQPLQATALGGAIGGGLGYLATGITRGGMKAPGSGKELEKTVMELASKETPKGISPQKYKKLLSKGASREQILKMLRAGKIRRLAVGGAVAGLGTGVYQQARKKILEKRLAGELKNKRKKTASYFLQKIV